MTKSSGNQVEKNRSKTEKIKEIDPLTWKFWKKRRYVIVLMAFFAYFVNYSLRINLSVAIVAMTENRTVVHSNGSITHEQDFPWDSKQKGLLLSAFFFGYILTQCIGGYLGARYGGNHIVGSGIGAAALVTLLTPITAKHSWELFIALRAAEGFLTGGTFPSMLAVWARWAPPMERSRMASLAFCGIHIGIVVTLPLSGYLASNYGWESIFYVFGSIGVLWYVGWSIIVKAGPEEDPFCSGDETRYIQEALGQNGENYIKQPWKAILTSPPVYAIIISNFCDDWGAYTLLTQMPTFLKDVLKFNLDKAGLVSAIPYLTMGLLLGPVGYFADWFQMKGYLTTTQVRKTFNCISNMSKGFFMILAAQLIPSEWSVLCITLALGLGAFGLGGTGANPLDISPKHASIIYGITNTFGTIPGVICPYLTGVVVQKKADNDWCMVFYIVAGIHLTGMLMYCILASGELQEWAKISGSEKENCKKPAGKISSVVDGV